MKTLDFIYYLITFGRSYHFSGLVQKVRVLSEICSGISRLALTICISHSSKSDIHEIIMNLLDELKKASV